MVRISLKTEGVIMVGIPFIINWQEWREGSFSKALHGQNYALLFQTLQILQKTVDVNHINSGVFYLLQYIIVSVFCHNKPCISFKRTIHEFVIIRISCDKPQMVIDLNHFGIWQIQDGLNHIGGNFRP